MEVRTPQSTPLSQSNWLGAFAHPPFAIVWIANALALIGIAMYDTASGWLMTTLDPNPLNVSLVHAATNLPMFLFTLPAGAIADIVDPRRLIIAVSCSSRPDRGLRRPRVASISPPRFLLLLTTFLLSAGLVAERAGVAVDPAAPGPEARSAGRDRGRQRRRLQPEPHGRPRARRVRDREFRRVDAVLGVRRRQSRRDRRPPVAAAPRRNGGRCRRSG